MASNQIPSCQRCKTVESVLLRYQIISNGAHQYFWYCTHCECKVGLFLPHELVKSWNLPETFYTKALVADWSKSVPCAIDGCPNTDVELHHFAPKKFFGDDAEAWPKAHLCRYHHRLWHNVINGVKQYTGDTVLETQREEIRKAMMAHPYYRARQSVLELAQYE